MYAQTCQLFSHNFWGTSAVVPVLKFRVSLMAVGIAYIFLFEILLQGNGQINSGLVSQADQYPKHIRHLISQVPVFVAFLKTLIAVGTGHDAGQLAGLFR